MKKTILILLLVLILISSTSVVEAKILPRFKSSAKKSSAVSSGVAVSPRLRKDKKALIINFGNLGKAKNVTYTLMYQTNGKDEGVSGSLDSSAGNSASRELLFGTCSSGVCRNHGSITKMKLEVITELTSGKKFLRRFGIKV